jgi:hypothetical protein
MCKNEGNQGSSIPQPNTIRSFRTLPPPLLLPASYPHTTPLPFSPPCTIGAPPGPHLLVLIDYYREPSNMYTFQTHGSPRAKQQRTRQIVTHHLTCLLLLGPKGSPAWVNKSFRGIFEKPTPPNKLSKALPKPASHNPRVFFFRGWFC